jgi:pimeloyl-ACP methyl ester carboxylesterase
MSGGGGAGGTRDVRTVDGRIGNDGYAPYPLTADAAALGLTETTVSSSLGTAVARSRKTTRSRRATIFLHGAAGSWTTWTPLLRAADEAKLAIANPILIDLPGWGDATLTREGERRMLETLSSLVKASAEDLGYTEWDIVGHSMGGFVALHMASIWPECVLSVGSISGTTWTLMDAAQHPVRHFWRLPGFVMLWRSMQGMAHTGSVGAGLARGLDRIHALRGAMAPLFRHPRRIPASVISALGLEVRPRSFSAAVRMGSGYDASGRWAEIDCAVVALAGDRDIFSRPADMVELGATLPDSRREVIADCGHFAHIERPNEVLSALGYARPARER